MRFRALLASAFALTLFVSPAALGAADPQRLAEQAIEAAGGEDKLLRLFRIKENLYLGEAPKPSVRTSVLEPPAHWWMNRRDRVVQDKEPAIDLVWAWTLGILVDPKSKLAAAPETTIDGKPADGLTISGSVTPPMTLYFDRATHRLLRIDHRGHQHKLSDWRQIDGTWYPARCAGFNPQGKQWYHTEIVEIERLRELPTDLRR